jgi:hypothetical protein
MRAFGNSCNRLTKAPSAKRTPRNIFVLASVTIFGDHVTRSCSLIVEECCRGAQLQGIRPAWLSPTSIPVSIAPREPGEATKNDSKPTTVHARSSTANELQASFYLDRACPFCRQIPLMRSRLAAPRLKCLGHHGPRPADARRAIGARRSL